MEGPQDRATHDPVSPEDGAGFVDQHVAPVAHRCSYRADRPDRGPRPDLFDPEEAEAKRACTPPSTASVDDPPRRRDHRRAGATSRPPPTSPTPSPSRPRFSDGATTSLEDFGRTCPSTYAVPWPLGRLGTRHRLRAGDLRPPRRLQPRRARVHREHRSWITVEQLGEWCDRLRDQVKIHASARPQRAPAHRPPTSRTRLRSRSSRTTRPACSRSAPDHRGGATSTTSSTGPSARRIA